jgi:hypothetical protein
MARTKQTARKGTGGGKLAKHLYAAGKSRPRSDATSKNSSGTTHSDDAGIGLSSPSNARPLASAHKRSRRSRSHSPSVSRNTHAAKSAKAHAESNAASAAATEVSDAASAAATDESDADVFSAAALAADEKLGNNILYHDASNLMQCVAGDGRVKDPIDDLSVISSWWAQPRDQLPSGVDEVAKESRCHLSRTTIASLDWDCDICRNSFSARDLAEAFVCADNQVHRVEICVPCGLWKLKIGEYNILPDEDTTILTDKFRRPSITLDEYNKMNDTSAHLGSVKHGCSKVTPFCIARVLRPVSGVHTCTQLASRRCIRPALPLLP